MKHGCLLSVLLSNLSNGRLDKNDTTFQKVGTVKRRGAIIVSKRASDSSKVSKGWGSVTRWELQYERQNLTSCHQNHLDILLGYSPGHASLVDNITPRMKDRGTDLKRWGAVLLPEENKVSARTYTHVLTQIYRTKGLISEDRRQQGYSTSYNTPFLI